MTILRFLRCFNLKLYVQGTVIKTNSNQRYATNSETGFLLRELARRAIVPVQVRGPPIQRWWCQIHNGTLWTFVINNWEDIGVFLIEKCLILRVPFLNWVVPSFYGKSLELTLIVPLSGIDLGIQFRHIYI